MMIKKIMFKLWFAFVLFHILLYVLCLIIAYKFPTLHGAVFGLLMGYCNLWMILFDLIVGRFLEIRSMPSLALLGFLLPSFIYSALCCTVFILRTNRSRKANQPHG